MFVYISVWFHSIHLLVWMSDCVRRVYNFSIEDIIDSGLIMTSQAKDQSNNEIKAVASKNIFIKVVDRLRVMLGIQERFNRIVRVTTESPQLFHDVDEASDDNSLFYCSDSFDSDFCLPSDISRKSLDDINKDWESWYSRDSENPDVDDVNLKVKYYFSYKSKLI